MWRIYLLNQLGTSDASGGLSDSRSLCGGGLPESEHTGNRKRLVRREDRFSYGTFLDLLICSTLAGAGWAG